MKTLLGVLVPLLALATPALAEDARQYSFGGDQYVSGKEVTISSSVTNDAFAAGLNVTVNKEVDGDVHAGGYSVSIKGPVSGNIYAAGNTISITGAVGRDVTAIGGTIDLGGSAPISGNLRSAGGTITVDRPVSGSALIAGGTININAPISGDLTLSSESVDFGPDARVDGNVEIRSSKQITVPASVAPADRVTYVRIDPAAHADDAHGVVDHAMDGNPFTSWFGKVAGALAIIVYGAILLAVFPRRTEIGFMTAMAKPWKSLFFGVLAASTFVGLVLVLLASLVGIPLVPVALVLLVLAALTGFVAGTYFVADRVLGAFRYETDTLWKRIGALTIGLIAVWILGIIPFLGWLLPFALGLYGLGALCFSAIGRRIDTRFHIELANSVGA